MKTKIKWGHVFLGWMLSMSCLFSQNLKIKGAVAKAVSPEVMMPRKATPAEVIESKKIYQESLKVQKTGDFKKSIELLQKALKMDPCHSSCLNHYAWFIAVDGPVKDRDLKKALKLSVLANATSDYKDRDILDTLGEIYFRMGEKELAIQTEEKALSRSLAGKSSAGYIRRQLKKFRTTVFKKTTQTKK